MTVREPPGSWLGHHGAWAAQMRSRTLSIVEATARYMFGCPHRPPNPEDASTQSFRRTALSVRRALRSSRRTHFIRAESSELHRGLKAAQPQLTQPVSIVRQQPCADPDAHSVGRREDAQGGVAARLRPWRRRLASEDAPPPVPVRARMGGRQAGVVLWVRRQHIVCVCA